MTDQSADTAAPEIQELEQDIQTTRSSLVRKVDEIGRRLQPEEVKAEIKDAVRRRLDPEPYLGWIAMTLTTVGALLAWRSWPRSRQKGFPATDVPMPTDCSESAI